MDDPLSDRLTLVSLGPKETVTKFFKEAGGYLDVRSRRDFLRDKKQVTNLKYSKNID